MCIIIFNLKMDKLYVQYLTPSSRTHIGGILKPPKQSINAEMKIIYLSSKGANL